METQTDQGVDKIQIFGKADRDAQGNIASQMPAFYNTAQIELLEEEIGKYKRALESGIITADKIMLHKQELGKAEEKLKDIRDSEPNLSEGEKDRVTKQYKQLGTKISQYMYSIDEESRGLVDAHQESNRNTKPCIVLDKDGIMFAQECGVRNIVKDGKAHKVSRNDASRMWKILGSLIGDYTNVEYLRKKTGSSKKVM